MSASFRSPWPGFEGLKAFNQHFSFPKLATDFAPRVDIYQTDQQVVVKAELPGMTAEDTLELRVTSESVTIRGEMKRNKSSQVEQCCHQECYQGTFLRVLSLPVEVYPEQAVAEYTNGLLTISIPKKSDAHSLGFDVKVKLPPASAK